MKPVIVHESILCELVLLLEFIIKNIQIPTIGNIRAISLDPNEGLKYSLLIIPQ